MVDDFPANADAPYPIALGGGLDTETPVLSQNPGGVIGSENYEPKVGGGYARVGGYLRYDGRTRPSDVEVTLLGAQGTFGAMVAGNTVIGAPSGASATVVYATETHLAVVRVTGAFASGDTLTVGGIYKGVALTEPAVMALEFNDMAAAAEDYLRTEIGKVPGLDGTPVRGAAILYGVLYAWRDFDVSSQKVYKATNAGWVEVPLLQRVAFTNGTVAPVEGAVITKGGVTATVRRVVAQAGDWTVGNKASGWLIISGASGAFTAGALTGGGTLDLSGAQSQIVLAPGGRWVLKPYNFSGGLTMRLYGADGVNDLIEFDGTVLVPIPVSMPVKPSTIELHKQYLWAAFGVSVQRSSIQDPYAWNVITGSAELAMGDTVTDLVSVAGQKDESALMVLAKDKSAVIYGDATTFQIDTLSSKVGGQAYTAQVLGRVVALDAAGMRDFTPTQSFGNFTSQTITEHIRRKATSLTARASVVSSRYGRYRLFLNDGSVLVGAPGKRWSWMFCSLPFQVNVACEGEMDGLSRVFVGCDDGYVREADVSRSFDGEPVSHWLKLPYSNLKKPGRRKKVPRSELEVSGQSAGRISYAIEADYGDPEKLETSVVTVETPPPATLWDIGNWDTGVWDGQAGQTVHLRTLDVGQNFALTVFGESKTELPHELHSVIVYHRLLRSVR